MESGSNSMEINPHRRLEPARRAAAGQRPAGARGEAGTAAGQSGDLFTGTEVQKLSDQLDGMADVRREWVLKGKDLLADKSYPGQDQLRDLARMLVEERGPSSSSGKIS